MFWTYLRLLIKLQSTQVFEMYLMDFFIGNFFISDYFRTVFSEKKVGWK